MTEFVLGGGCFWCTEAVFRRLKGVRSVVSGYSGGTTPRPSYYQVGSGSTGHAEVIKITFDEAIIPADTILDIFFLTHNPTTLNQQGADKGTQYRSIMLYKDAEQQALFERAIERAEVLWENPVVTAVVLLEVFYEAEDEHQDYFNKNPEAGYCQVVIEPKLNKARATYAEWFKENE